MKKNKLLVFLIVALIISVCAYFYFKKKEKEKTGAAPAAATDPGTDIQPAAPQQSTVPPVKSTPAVTLQTGKFPLQIGSTGKAVQMLQVIAGVTPDGKWGSATDAAMTKVFKAARMSGRTVGVQDFVTLVLISSGTANFPFYQGSPNASIPYIKALQIMLGLKVDGIFGANTGAACKKEFGHTTCSQAEFTSLVKRMLNS